VITGEFVRWSVAFDVTGWRPFGMHWRPGIGWAVGGGQCSLTAVIGIAIVQVRLEAPLCEIDGCRSWCWPADMGNRVERQEERV
jgi:hypothetical protein